MDLHSLTPSENYTYERMPTKEGELVLAQNDEGVTFAIEDVRQFSLPFLPGKWKTTIHEIRIRRAEIRVAARADEVNERYNTTSPMNVR